EVEEGGRAPELDPAVRDLVVHRAYPGNVRDLRQLAQRVHARHAPGCVVTVGDLPEEEWRCLAGAAGDPTVHAPARVSLEDAVRRVLAGGMTLKELQRITAELAVGFAISEARGSLRVAARRLGVTERALQLRRAAAPRAGGPYPPRPRGTVTDHDEGRR